MTETYSPCSFGIHVCGISADGEEPITIANFRTQGALSARRLWDAARERFEVAEGEPDDLLVDLCLGPYEVVDNFAMTRQMLEPLRAFAAALT